MPSCASTTATAARSTPAATPRAASAGCSWARPASPARPSRPMPACSAPSTAASPSWSPSTWARRASAGTRSRSPRSSATPAPSSCRSGRSTTPILHSPSVVNMGNPHAIFWVDDVEAYDLARFGPLLENHPIFPERANISLAHVISPTAITRQDLGARRRHHPRLRHRRLRRRRRRRAQGADRAPGHGDAARRAAGHRLARRRPRLDDRPGRDRVRGHPRPRDARLGSRRARGAA